MRAINFLVLVQLFCWSSLCAQPVSSDPRIEQIRAGMPVIDQLVNDNPGDLDKRYARGGARLLLGNFAGADEDFAFLEARHYNKNRAALLDSRGVCLTAQKKYAEAVTQFTAAIAVKPTPDSYQNRANAYFEMGRYREALSDGFQSIKLNERHGLAQGLVGCCYVKSGQYAYAMPYLNAAIKTDPKNCDALHYRGEALTKTGQAAAGARDISEALRLGYAPGRLRFVE